MQNCSNNQSKIYQGDCREKLAMFDENTFQAIIADPPYFQVLLEENWDNQWQTEEDYLNWTEDWIEKSARVLKDDGLFFYLRTTGKTRTSLASRLLNGNAYFAVSRYADLGQSRRLQRALQQFYSVLRNDSRASQKQRYQTLFRQRCRQNFL